MRETQLSIFLENKPEVLARVCQSLAAENINHLGTHEINIEYAYGSCNGTGGVLYLCVSDIEAAEKLLG